jgi:signal transduction histidine kinase
MIPRTCLFLRMIAALVVGLLSVCSTYAQSTGPKPADSPTDARTGVASVDGRSVRLTGVPTVSIPASSEELMIGLTSELGKRMRYRVEGLDQTWQEGPSWMIFGVRFFDSHDDQISQQSVELSGQSAGWNGDLQRPVFVHRQKVFEAPPHARKFWIVISSAGPPQSLGTLLIKGVVVSRLSADGASEIILRAPVRHDSGAVGFCTDGTRSHMARLLSLAPHPPDPPSDCFAIMDDDVQAHAEWRTMYKDAPSVSDGDRLLIEWDEAFSIGMGGPVRPSYQRPPAGSYSVHVQTVDLLGQPAGAESTLIIRVLAPWWQRPWAWSVALAATIGGTVGLTRYFAHRRMREQLIYLKEERLVEQERLRIARDIHDTLAQGFTGVIVQLEAAEDAQSRGLARETTAHLQRARDLARDGLQEARLSVRALRHQPLERKQLAEALGALLDKMTAGTGLHAKLIVDGASRRLASEVEQNLLCIGQEALANVLRHAHASRFTARLVYGNDAISLELQDNGSGFDPTAVHDGFGLIGMKERAQTMGGELSIQTTAPGGTTISMAVPVLRNRKSGEQR